METERVAAVVGGGSSSISTTAQRLLRLANVPQVAYTSTSPLLSNKEKFPTFSRVVPPDTFQGPALAELCFSQNWTNVGLISTTDEYATEVCSPPPFRPLSFPRPFLPQIMAHRGSGHATDSCHHSLPYPPQLANAFTKSMEDGGGKIVSASVLIWNEAVSAQGVEIAIRSMKRSGVRIIALLVANEDAAKDVLAEAARQGLAGPSYVYVGGDATMDEKVLLPTKAEQTPEFMSLVREAAEGAVGLIPYLTRSGPAYEEFLELWRSVPPLTDSELAYGLVPGGSIVDAASLRCDADCIANPPWGAAYAYEAVRLVCRAWVNVTASGADPRDLPSNSLLDAIRSVSLAPEESVLGGLQLNATTGDPVSGRYSVIQFQPKNSTEKGRDGRRRLSQDGLEPILDRQTVGKIVEDADSGEWTFTTSVPLDYGWQTSDGYAPEDPPKDGSQTTAKKSYIGPLEDVGRAGNSDQNFVGDLGNLLVFSVNLQNSFDLVVGLDDSLPATKEACAAAKLQILAARGVGVPYSVTNTQRGCKISINTEGMRSGDYCLDFTVNGELKTGAKGNCYYKILLNDPDFSPLDVLIWALPVAFGVLFVGALVTLLLLWRRRRRLDKDWVIDESELKMADPPVVLGEGGQGDVVEATFRGTPVAVKRYFNITSPRYLSHSTLTSRMCSEKAPLEVNGQQLKERATAAESKSLMDKKTPRAERQVSFPPGVGGSSSDISATNLENSISPTLEQAPSLPRTDTAQSAGSVQSFGSAQRSSPSLSLRMSSYTKSGATEKGRMRQEMKIISRLRHPNIVQNLGAVMKGRTVMVVMERMSRGSLHSMLVSATPADLGLLLQILLDAIRGLRYLHEAKPPYIHGDLKSLNILVDENLKGKLSDFGLSFLKSSKNLECCGGSPLWMAPEMFKKGASASESTDIYALGVTMMELWTRRSPYWELTEVETPLEEIVRRIREENLRPSDPPRSKDEVARGGNGQGKPAAEDNLAVPKDLLDLAHECMMSNPKRRPDLTEIESRISAVAEKLAPGLAAGGGRGNSQQARLLHDILPPKVARALLEGRKVEPETFDTVTIFFSDVVNFTRLSRDLPPEKVMSFLDRMYSSFDALARTYGLFKVETIGDAYMCVGGLPEPQADHTLRVARFALEARQAASKVFIDPQDPGKGKLKIRVGFHTGSVVASVVGSTNPRYCLFGDTVNTASRMESNSKPGCVNCSPQAQRALTAQIREQGFQGIKVTPRGRVDVKGKGSMEMFFIDEDTGFALGHSGSAPDQEHSCSSHRPAVDWDELHFAGGDSGEASGPVSPYSNSSLNVSERGGGKYG